MASSTGAAASPVSVGAASAPTPPPSTKQVDQSIVKIIVICSVFYLWYITRNIADRTAKSESRSNEDYLLTDAEAAALTPSVKRLLELLPGGSGLRAAVQIGEQLSIVFVLMEYAERTAPLRDKANNGVAARPQNRTPQGVPPDERQRSHDQAAGSPSPGGDGPAIAAGVIGSQYA